MTTRADDSMNDNLARADVKQFNGQSPEPQNAHLRMLAQMFSGETGIPIGELGIIGDANPTSAEALQASRDDLISTAEQTTDDWSPDVASAMTRALTMLNGDLPENLDLRARWRSICGHFSHVRFANGPRYWRSRPGGNWLATRLAIIARPDEISGLAL